MQISFLYSTVDILETIKDMCQANKINQKDADIIIYEKISNNKVQYREIMMFSKGKLIDTRRIY